MSIAVPTTDPITTPAMAPLEILELDVEVVPTGARVTEDVD